MQSVPRKPIVFLPIPSDRAAEDRPFTDPAVSETDLDTLRSMLGRLYETLSAHPELRRRMRAAFRTVVDEDGRPHQIIIARPDDLRRREAFTVVGFFGRMQEGAEQVTLAAVKEVDEALIGDFPRFGGLLSYNSLLLPNGNWGNMAIFKDMGAMERWNRNPRHATAIRQLAALHYASIRLHVAQMEGGLEQHILHPVRTKYYQFDGAAVWRAMRTTTPTTPSS